MSEPKYESVTPLGGGSIPRPINPHEKIIRDKIIDLAAEQDENYRSSIGERLYNGIPHNYGSFRQLQELLGFYCVTYDLIQSDFKGARDEIEQLQSNMPHVASQVTARKFGYPWSVISDDLATAAVNTEPPEYWSHDDVKLSFPCEYFLLPQGVLETEMGKPVLIASVFHVDLKILNEAGLEVEITDEKNRKTMEEHRLYWFCFYTGNIDSPSYFGSVEIDEEGRAKVVTDREFLGDSIDIARTNEFLDKGVSLLMQLITIRNLRPELKDDGPAQGFVKRTKKGKEIWNPKWFGRSYRTERSYQGGTHSSPRMHWRRGHWRGVRYGKGKLKLRLQWIEPTLVGK